MDSRLWRSKNAKKQFFIIKKKYKWYNCCLMLCNNFNPESLTLKSHKIEIIDTGCWHLLLRCHRRYHDNKFDYWQLFDIVIKRLLISKNPLNILILYLVSTPSFLHIIRLHIIVLSARNAIQRVFKNFTTITKRCFCAFFSFALLYAQITYRNQPS